MDEIPQRSSGTLLGMTSRSNPSYLPAVVLMGLTLVAAVMLDAGMSRWFAQHRVHGEMSNLLEAAEHFGTPFGQLMILLTILIASGWRDLRVLRVFLCATAAGMSANVIKLMVARARPRDLNLVDSDFTLAPGFDGMFPFGAGGSAMQSFPSAHTASAFGFAVVMSWAWPAARIPFFVIASLTGIQRICSTAHYPSDVIFGAALGWMVGTAFISWRPLCNYFGKLEADPTAAMPWLKRLQNSSAAPDDEASQPEEVAVPSRRRAA